MTSLLLVGFAEPGNAAATLLDWAFEVWGPKQDDVVLKAALVPRSYAKATEVVRARLLQDRPDLFVLFDTDSNGSEWKLHNLAANYDDSSDADSDGAVHSDHIIDPDGPVAYRNRLPLDGLWDKFLVERVPARMAHKAGGHVFNHVFYDAMHTIARERLPTLGGALETPPMTGPNGRGREALVDEMAMVLAVLVQLYPAMLKDQETP